MRISAIREAGHSVLHGKWVDNISRAPGLKLKVGGLNAPEARQVFRDMVAGVPDAMLNDRDFIRKCNIEQYVTVTSDWNLTEDDGKTPIPFSKDKMREYLNDPEIGVVFEAYVAEAISTVGIAADQQKKADEKN